MADKTSSNAYWAANIRIILISLVIWFACSFGLGIILRPALSSIHIGGADLGFWFAHWGLSISTLGRAGVSIRCLPGPGVPR